MIALIIVQKVAPPTINMITSEILFPDMPGPRVSASKEYTQRPQVLTFYTAFISPVLPYFLPPFQAHFLVYELFYAISA